MAISRFWVMPNKVKGWVKINEKKIVLLVVGIRAAFTLRLRQ